MVRRMGVSLRVFEPVLTAIVVLIALQPCLAFAQTATATIVGVVKDASGALIPGVSITVKHTDTGQTRTAISSDSGGYNVALLPVGAYEITTTMPGFKQQVRTGINLVIGQQAVIDLTLEVGGAAEQITISEEAPLVNTTLSSTSGLITEQQVKDLPLNGRSFDQLLVLNVGVVNNTSNMGGGGGFPAFSVAGHRQETNRFMINGVDWVGGNATHQFITPSGASSQLLGVEAVREYNVLEHTYGAEYGKRAGGQVSIVTTSGTNQWHGDLFEYLRNSALDARNFFEEAKGPFKRNQFGGTLGGPLKKDKLFVFGNYEGFRQRRSQTSRAIYPDGPSRQGLLPCYLATPSACPASAPFAARAALVPVPNLKPGMLPYANLFWPVPNGPQVPSPDGLPTGTAYNFNDAVQATYENFVMGRFDYVISPKNSFFANYTISDGERDTPQADMYYTQFVPIRSQTFSLSETHVFSPTVVNSVILGWVRPYGGQVTTTNGLGPAIPKNLIFLEGGNPGSLVVGGGATTVAPSSVTPVPGNNPLLGINEFYSLADDLRFTKGKHSFSTGVWVQRVHENSYGAAQFSAGGASHPTMARFLQDDPANPFSLNRNPQMLGYRMTQGAWYFQDEMKLRSNLTMRLGLRHEMTNGWNEVGGRCANYTFDKNWVISTEPRMGTSCLTENHAKLLLQPRVGLAWDPTGTGTWAVRAGFGIHNDLQDNLANRTYSNPPFNAREQINGPTLSVIPLSKNTPLPRTCGLPGGLPQPACGLYSPGGVDPVLFTPTSQQWSLTIERGIARDLMLSVGYVGSQSYHTPLSVNMNAIQPIVCGNPQGCISGGTLTNGNPVGVNSQVLVPQGTLYHPPGPRPNPNVSSGTQWIDQGTSSYHAMDVSLTKRISRGLAYKANYTYGKAMDLNSAILAPSAGNEPSNIPSPYDRKRLNRGVASFSVLHQFSGYTSYQLPFGNGQRFASGASGLMEKLIGGWQWNTGIRVASGFPFTPLAGSNVTGTGDQSNSDVPNWNPNFKGPVIIGRPDQWFDPRAFVLPAQGTFGNVARGSLRGPGLFNVDTSLFKNMTIAEGLKLSFRTEAFNVFNRPNFAFPNEVLFAGRDYTSSGGVITQTATFSRQMQFALKLIF
ncbi:MAG: TonB-dependent receptor [Acidobacteria bacterium]|nr:MAG: TonB-dependent receptor [Acidobacteriota bacterium]